MDTGGYEPTHGSSTREPRAMMERVLLFRLSEEVAALRAEAQYADGERNSRMLAKDVDFRVLLTVLRPGTAIEEKDGDGRVSIQLLEGEARLDLDGEQVSVGSGSIVAVDRGHPWRLEATAEVALLLTVAWPKEKAFV